MPVTLLPFMLLIVPVMEITLFIVVGGKIGAFWTIGLVLFTAILGSILLRIEGFRTFARIREKMNAGQIPSEELVKGAMILVAGVLLLTPGFITDTIGFGLFIPFVRKIIWNFLASRFTAQRGTTNNFGFGANMDFSMRGEDPAARGFKHDRDDIFDLDPDEFSEKPNAESPWFSEIDDNTKQMK